MDIRTERFGRTKAGEDVTKIVLKNGSGVEAAILSYGGIIQSLKVPAANGEAVDVCLGFNSITEYENNGGEYIGAMIGRYANRIGSALFTLNSVDYPLAVNDGPNHLHGGARGFDKYIYEYIIEDDKLMLTRTSPDMEEGYPGNLEVCFIYRLTAEGELVLEYDAVSDADTLVNLTNHTYFNLSGEGAADILDHVLMISSSFFSENDSNCLPTGRLLPVSGTPFDFRNAKPIGRDMGMDDVQLKCGNGYDHNFVLDKSSEEKPLVTLASPRSGIRMAMYTTKPCVQFYAGNFLSGKKGKSGVYGKHSGLCLETQYRPNALGPDEMPSQFLKKGEKYHHVTVYQFS